MTMKKRHGVFFGFAVLLITAIFTLTGCDNNGSSDDDPIQIETAAQFAEIRNNLSGHYILANDINLSGFSNFEPIGRFEPLSDAPEDEETPKLELAFTGVFDGNGHTISNVAISIPTGSGVGLFGCVADNGVIKNLVVENVTVSGMMLVGGVIGYGAAENAVENIVLQGTNNITGSFMVAGIVGGGFCPIINCEATANVTLTGDNGQAVGILAGGMEDASIINCTAKGTITVTGSGAAGIGGLAACALSASEIRNCTTDVTINTTGADCIMIGGLVGYSGAYPSLNETPTVISNCTVKAVITASNSAERIGGIVGSGFYMDAYKEYRPIPSSFTVQNCSTSGSITSSGSLLATIAGYIYDNSTVESSTSTMTINGSAGALVGGNKTTVDLDGLK
jgi:hypothetical protein